MSTTLHISFAHSVARVTTSFGVICVGDITVPPGLVNWRKSVDGDVDIPRIGMKRACAAPQRLGGYNESLSTRTLSRRRAYARRVGIFGRSHQ